MVRSYLALGTKMYLTWYAGGVVLKVAGKVVVTAAKSVGFGKITSKITQSGLGFVSKNLTRTSIRAYLSEVTALCQKQISRDLELIGLKISGKSPCGRFIEFKDWFGNIRVKIHPADRITTYNHIHIYDKAGNSLDTNLKVVSRSSTEAHIPIGGN